MSDVAELLLRWNSGDEPAKAALSESIYAELNVMAERHLANERHVVALPPNPLVQEAYLKLTDMNRIEWQNRAHFLAIAAKVMREILVDHARQRGASKRDGGKRVTLSAIAIEADRPATDALMINQALEQLAEIDPERARLVELRYCGALTIEESAAVMSTSPATVRQDLISLTCLFFRQSDLLRCATREFLELT